jgi:hypothetical protein
VEALLDTQWLVETCFSGKQLYTRQLVNAEAIQGQPERPKEYLSKQELLSMELLRTVTVTEGPSPTKKVL